MKKYLCLLLLVFLLTSCSKSKEFNTNIEIINNPSVSTQVSHYEMSDFPLHNSPNHTFEFRSILNHQWYFKEE